MIDFLALHLQCAPHVAPQTIEAIARAESAANPFAIGVNGQRLLKQPRSAEQAKAWADWLLERGYNIDLGLMQINSSNLRRLGLTTANVFDPCTNVTAGAKVLTDNYRQAKAELGHGQPALLAALRAYNTGSRKPTATGQGYALRVQQHASTTVTETRNDTE